MKLLKKIMSLGLALLTTSQVAHAAWTDATHAVISALPGTLIVNNSTFGGDPAPGVVKQVEITLNDGTVKTYNENTQAKLIKSARYGAGTHWNNIDVVKIGALMVFDAFLPGQPFVVNNATLGGDPAPGTAKQLQITLDDGTVKSYNENTQVKLIKSARYGSYQQATTTTVSTVPAPVVSTAAQQAAQNAAFKSGAGETVPAPVVSTAAQQAAQNAALAAQNAALNSGAGEK